MAEASENIYKILPLIQLSIAVWPHCLYGEWKEKSNTLGSRNTIYTRNIYCFLYRCCRWLNVVVQIVANLVDCIQYHKRKLRFCPFDFFRVENYAKPIFCPVWFITAFVLFFHPTRKMRRNICSHCTLTISLWKWEIFDCMQNNYNVGL